MKKEATASDTKEAKSAREMFQGLIEQVTSEEMAQLEFGDLEESIAEQGKRIMKRVLQEYTELRAQEKIKADGEEQCVGSISETM